MTPPNPEKQTNNQNPNAEDQNTEDKTYDPRDLVYKSGFQKNPREIIENPAVTPQIRDESSDSQVGMDQSDRNENAS